MTRTLGRAGCWATAAVVPDVTANTSAIGHSQGKWTLQSRLSCGIVAPRHTSNHRLDRIRDQYAGASRLSQIELHELRWAHARRCRALLSEDTIARNLPVQPWPARGRS